MTRKTHSIDQLSTVTTWQARTEMAMMQRDLNKLRDSLSGLTRGIKAPVIKTPRHMIKKTTSDPSLLLGLGGMGLSYLLDAAGVSDVASATSGSGNQKTGSFYTSATQSSSAVLTAIGQGQRVR